MSTKIASVMTPQKTERKPSTTGSVRLILTIAFSFYWVSDFDALFDTSVTDWNWVLLFDNLISI